MSEWDVVYVFNRDQCLPETDFGDLHSRGEVDRVPLLDDLKTIGNKKKRNKRVWMGTLTCLRAPHGKT